MGGKAPTDIFSTSFGRTDLRIGPSRPKNREGLDFEVHLSVDPPKPHQFNQKLVFGSKLLADLFRGYQKIKGCSKK